MSSIRTVALVVALSALSGCYHIKYYNTAVPGPGEVHRIWVHNFLGGLVTVGEVDLDAKCPTGVYKLKSNMNVVDLLLASVTGLIYTPMNVVVTCASGAAK